MVLNLGLLEGSNVVEVLVKLRVDFGRFQQSINTSHRSLCTPQKESIQAFTQPFPPLLAVLRL